MAEALISIVIPVHNAEKYLGECLDGILAQTYKDWELVLVDDGSTDGSARICKRYAAAMPERIRHIGIRGAGVSAARNRGIREAKGRYVTFVDADDILLPHALEHMLSIAQKHPECGIVAGQLSHERPEGRRKVRIRVDDAHSAVAATLYQERLYSPSACGKLYRRELTAEMFVPGRRYEDLECFARVYMAAGCVATTSEVVYYYRPNPSSFINTWSESRLDALWAVDSLRAFSSADAELARAALARSFSAYFNVFRLAVRNGRADVASECMDFIRAHRGRMLADRRVRLKNKAGALLSYLGHGVLKLF